ncbi:MAG: PAS domain S-box protein [Syntrophotaleaceae bacterium]
MEDLSADLRERALSFMKSVALRCPDPFYTCDPEDGFRFTFVNEGTCVHFGRTREELLSLRLVEVDARFSFEQWQEIWEEVQEKGSLFFETAHRHADGREIPVAISVNHFSQAGHNQFGGCIHDLRGHQEAERALRESEEMLRMVFNSARDAIVLNTVDGRILDVNEPFLRLHNISREKALSLTIDDVTADGAIELARKARAIWERTAAGEPQLVQWPSRRAGNGSSFMAEVYLRKVTLRGEAVILAQIKDLSEQRQAEEALRQGEKLLLQTRELLQFLIDGSPDLIAAVDQDLRLLCFNRAFVAILKQRHDVAPHLQQSLPELLSGHPEVLAQVQPLWQRALMGEAFSVSARIQDGDGEGRIYDLRFSPVRSSNGELLGAAHIGTDVTERVAYEKMLEQAKETAEEANRVKSAFLTNMGHELRTPLTVILGSLELLLDSEPTEAQRLLLDLAEKGGQNLLSIIEDLLDFCRIEEGKISLCLSSFSLRECLRQIVEMFRLPAGRKGLDLYLTIDPRLPETLVGDPNRLIQVMVNLVGNAVKFTDKGEVKISAMREGDSRIRLSVRDTGIGVTPDKQRLIFEPFTQADVSNTRRFGGTGLGLAISRDLVSMMGGELTVESRPGIGSIFSFCLPLNPQQLPPSPPKPDAFSPLERKTWGGRLLLAEDDPLVREMIVLMLSDAGWTVEVAEDGIEVVEKCREGSFAVVLMDLQMPRLGGLEAARRIRELDKGTGDHPCIIALTAHAGHKLRRECTAAGMDDFVSKPVRGSHLLAVIAKCLSMAAKG